MVEGTGLVYPEQLHACVLHVTALTSLSMMESEAFPSIGQYMPSLPDFVYVSWLKSESQGLMYTQLFRNSRSSAIL